MVFIRFEGFNVLALLLASFALQSLSVHGVHRQERRLMEENPVNETQENDASLNKELAAGTLGISSVSSKARIGGRKTGMRMKKEDGEMTSRSNKDKNALKEGPRDFLNNQGQESKLKAMTKNPCQSSCSVASHSSLNTNKIFSNEDQSEEWRKLLEDADKKVMQMMRRDYSGMKRPRRKPPINNHEPKN